MILVVASFGLVARAWLALGVGAARDAAMPGIATVFSWLKVCVAFCRWCERDGLIIRYNEKSVTLEIPSLSDDIVNRPGVAGTVLQKPL